MPDLMRVEYDRSGKSTRTNAMGMREMQERAFAKRDAQYLLIKAPPASGKSRALMYIALDKLRNQGKKKVVVAVPERSIGSSFAPVKLTESGFFADWNVKPEHNLCTPGGEARKVQAFLEFMKGDAEALVCTHATLRFAFEALDESAFDDVVLAIDEFHHVSAEDSSRLGEVLRAIMAKSNAHIVAMTGSYFRGDSVPVLRPEDEAKFRKLTYSYYDQLNGYEHLKSLGIGYHFYQGKYTSAIGEVLDPDKKTLIHIPSVNSAESTGDKYQEVDEILDILGEVLGPDEETGVLSVRQKDGRILKVADLVYDDPRVRDKVVSFLRSMEDPEDVDIIIALGMAKEGFDWPPCEHTLTVGYRSSLTEIIQILGRATRDYPGKTHAQFTNLIAEPDAESNEVKVAVNNMLKAITASLLMEHVLAPNFRFKAKVSPDEKPEPGTILIKGLKEPSTERTRTIIEQDLDDLKAIVLQDPEVMRAIPGGLDPEVINKVLVPKVIQRRYPDLSTDEVEEVRQHIVTDSAVRSGEITTEGDRRFIRMADRFVNIDDLHIDLIDRVNPFQKAFEILSKSVTPPVLRAIRDVIQASKIEITEEEAILLWPKINDFRRRHGRPPDLSSNDPLERRMAEAIVFLRDLKRRRKANA